MKKIFLFLPVFLIAHSVLAVSLTEFSDGSVKALYHLNGDSVDSSGNGYNGTDTAIGYTAGKLNSGADLNGSTSFISLGTSLSLPGAQSVCGWEKLTDLANYNAFFSKRDGTGANVQIDFNGGMQTTGYLEFYNGSNSYDTTASISTGVYHHICYTLSSSGGTLKFYIDGVQSGSSVSPVSVGAGSGITARIGSHNNAEFLKGSVDEIVIFNKEITATSVEALYNSGNGAEVCLTAGCDDEVVATSTATSTIGFMSPQTDLMVQLLIEALFVASGIIVGYLAIKKLTKK